MDYCYALHREVYKFVAALMSNVSLLEGAQIFLINDGLRFAIMIRNSYCQLDINYCNLKELLCSIYSWITELTLFWILRRFPLNV